MRDSSETPHDWSNVRKHFLWLIRVSAAKAVDVKVVIVFYPVFIITKKTINPALSKEMKQYKVDLSRSTETKVTSHLKLQTC